MRVLITGAAGFLGSNLCDLLLAEGHEVIGMDNFITGKKENLAHLMGNERFSFFRHDVSKYIFVAGKLDAVMHFASPASPNPNSPFGYTNLPIQTMKAGALGTHNTLGVALANKARYLLASTSEVYGDPLEHPQTESYWGHVNPIGERSVYDEAKRFAEALTMAYHRFHDVNTGIVRIFNTYGPRMHVDDGRVVPNFIKQALKKEALTIYGDGEQTRSFCYVDDLINGIYKLLISDEHMPVNIGNPVETSINEFADVINALTNNPEGTVYEKEQRGEGDPQRRRPDITRAKDILNWSPNVSLDDGIMNTINYFKSELGIQ
ncbi:MAG: SDR family oxidoreductase [Chloroflexi bacterium]|jgi:dTDP-glucose 4,6-dehydratase|nr:SDR family oxidoreductase [Chloroflexota bacterium]MBT3669405.1 SDR family oxidoreductase [Chloroflexota bacterium]MBT4003299.1 SDR family oxidoreductase [Chloroflexota bacterium]MBT4304576.1 SDR family oxidoreductase [Chloroflexota bacterium]MBT4534083.1 SDR family oxidoreductase [Chloroflexota bacterium]